MNELDTMKNGEFASLPSHVAIIMDGNGRWAKQRGKLRLTGHRAGLQAVRKAVKFAVNRGIQVLTLYAFSSENWERPATEVFGLMQLFAEALDKEVIKLHKNNIKLKIIGDITRFSLSTQRKMAKAVELTAENTGLVLSIAANYGGRWDIVNAVNCIVQDVLSGKLSDICLTEQQVNQYLSLSSLPSVDLIIRTGGECRISNFLLWQSAYAEFHFTDTLWPDFDDKEFNCALEAYLGRERRFGKITHPQ